VTDWRAALVDSGAPMRLIYDVGESASPHDRFGRSTLRVWANGDVRLDHRKMGSLRAWGAVLPTGRVGWVRQQIAGAGFPTPLTLPRGPGVRRRLYARSGAANAQIELPLLDLPPAWAPVCAWLDALTTALGGADLSTAPPAPDIAAGTPLRHLDPSLAYRWFADPGILGRALQSLAAGRSPGDVLVGLPRAQEVPGRLDLRGLPGGTMDLPRANLASADLTGADLMSSDLEGARLGGARLVEADLAWARLVGADLRGADLQRCSLADADLSNADLRDTDLRGAELREANLAGARLEGARVAGTILENR